MMKISLDCQKFFIFAIFIVKLINPKNINDFKKKFRKFILQMNITKRFLKIQQISLSNFQYMKKYFSTYYKLFNNIWNFKIQSLKLFIKTSSMVLQKA